MVPCGVCVHMCKRVNDLFPVEDSDSMGVNITKAHRQGIISIMSQMLISKVWISPAPGLCLTLGSDYRQIKWGINNPSSDEGICTLFYDE